MVAVRSCSESNVRFDLLSISWTLAQLKGLIRISSVLITGEAGLRRTVSCAVPYAGSWYSPWQVNIFLGEIK